MDYYFLNLKYILLTVLVLLINCQKPTEFEFNNELDPYSVNYIPKSPANLTLSRKDNVIEIQWSDESLEETGFQIKRSINDSDFELIGNTGPNQITWRDTLQFPTYPIVYGVASISDNGMSHMTISDTLFSYVNIDYEILGQGAVYIEGFNNLPDSIIYNKNIKVTAVPSDCWIFDKWNNSDRETTISIELKKDTLIQATFLQNPNDYTINISQIGSGQIILTPNKSSYNCGEVVNITANPEIGWDFQSWSGNINSDQNTLQVTVTDDINITGAFEIQTFNLSVDVIGQGNVNESKKNKITTYQYGDIVELEAAPNDWWAFSNWSGDINSSSQIIQLTMKEDVSITANFEESNLSTVLDSRDSKEYQIVRISDQIWMAENLNIGTKINNTSNQNNNGQIEKYCYGNVTADCNEFGGLYTYEEAMNYLLQDGSKGICMEGWHIPTDNDWQTLEMNLGMSQSDAGRNGWRGTDQGKKLKSSENWDGSNSTGFSSLPAGIYTISQTSYLYMGINSFTAYISSNIKTVRQLSSNSEIKRTNEYWGWNNSALSVRCIKD
jgi:uncharacterized protein (TIGR02145 family)